MSKKRSNISGDQILPLRVPEDMRKRVRKCSDQARLSDADIMRMSIDRGISVVEKMFETVSRKAA